jgi:hypothetical protein
MYAAKNGRYASKKRRRNTDWMSPDFCLSFDVFCLFVEDKHGMMRSVGLFWISRFTP